MYVFWWFIPNRMAWTAACQKRLKGSKNIGTSQQPENMGQNPPKLQKSDRSLRPMQGFLF